MDIGKLHLAHEELLSVVAAGGFGPPPAGEWDAERVIVSGAELMVDEPRPIGQMLAGLGELHVPMHAVQLASLRS
jgi:hypothetical protein